MQSQPTPPFKFAGNDYLGLASHPQVIEALCAAARQYGLSSTGSRWSQGWSDQHALLERELADWMGAEEACLLSAAYLGGAVYFGRMAALGRRVVFCDAMVHVNQFLGMRAAGLEVRTFRHRDANDLRRLADGYDGPPAIVATDGVYGVSGEVAPLAGLAEEAARIGAELFVDDAHGVGVLGASGRGVTEMAGLHPSRVTVLGSMSKALGANGGFIAGRRELVELFRHSPEATGTTSLPPAVAAAARAALSIVRNDPGPRCRMEENAARMRATLGAAGISLADDRHPILGMLLADEKEARALERHLLAHGIVVPYFYYDSEPRHNLLRAVARAVYTPELLERFAAAISTRPRG